MKEVVYGFLIITSICKGYTVIAQSTSNVQNYTPSVLLSHNQYEISLFNNLYTQDGYRNEDGKFIDAPGQQTYYTGMLQFNYGISKSNRINIGLDVNLKAVRLDSMEGSSPLKVFSFANNDFSRTEVASIGPRIKINPCYGVKNFSFSSSFWIPLADSLENEPFLDYDKFTWWNQFYFDKNFNNKSQFFAEADLLFRLPKASGQTTVLSTPVSVFYSYFLSSKTTAYVMTQVSPDFIHLPEAPIDGSSRSYYSGYYAQAGIGFKYQLFSKLQLEGLYTNFFASENAGAGQTFNLGFKYIK